MNKVIVISSILAMLTSTAFAAVVAPPGDSGGDGGDSGGSAVRIGGTGSINTPHALALGEGKLSLSYHNLVSDDTLSQASFGVDGKLEIGITSFNLGKADEATYGNLKYQLVKETAATPAVAVGVLDITDKFGRNFYVAGTKTIPLLEARVTLGAYTRGNNKVFGSLEKTFAVLPGGKNVFPTTTIKVEYDGEDTNYGVSLATIPGLKIEAGSRSDHGYFGATYTFN